jgi:hypothetical protein
MKLASIERIKKVTKHNNADSLDIVEVLGFNVIVKLGQFKENDLVVFMYNSSTALNTICLFTVFIFSASVELVKRFNYLAFWTLFF